MRFMMFMHPAAAYDSTIEWEPKADDVSAMMAYNEELTRAGVLLALDGLQPPDKGARVRYSGGRATVTDGPFSESKEVIGGYWIIQVKSKEEAVAWATRCPAADGDMVEVRQVYEMSDFPEAIQEAAAELTVEPLAQPTETL